MKQKAISPKEANRIYYDHIASDYEKIDGRRNKNLAEWFKKRVNKIIKEYSLNVGSLLDLGCGQGFVAKNLKEIFKARTGIDISQEILNTIQDDSMIKVCGEADKLPFKDESFDMVIAFAMLHHIEEIKPVIKEVYRVLKPGGVFYADHDLDKTFYDRFAVFLKFYRTIFRKSSINTPEMKTLHEISEVHKNGVPSKIIIENLEETGFTKIKTVYHWYGLSRIADIFTIILGPTRAAPQGWAPLFSFTAQKPV